ncbi:MAG TPA: PAS domain S-box protein [Verrucomicrobiae bacterium]|nr:PAS domain S-box protein [Verrucomicrobiae bacterium]
MNIDLISESAWISVIEGTREVQFEFLALQLFLVNLRKRLQSKELSQADCVRELKAFCAKFSRLPIAEKDFSRIANQNPATTNRLLDPKEVAQRILAGQCLILAGEESLLAGLPNGNWIGGTIPYFMDQEGGCLCKDRIFVTEISAECQTSKDRYAVSRLPEVYQDAEEGTLSFIILPADSPIHTEFALHAPRYRGFALQPLVGWVAGIDLAMAGKAAPKVFCGGPEPLADTAVVMRVKLPPDRVAQVRIVNLFQPGDGDTIRFRSSGFSAATALINGQECNFAEYLRSIEADTHVPLVADYCGARVNVSFKSVDPQSGRVEFYAPVVPGIAYKLALPVKDYVSEFQSGLKQLSPDNLLFSCNCILNYLYSRLEGRRTSAFVGPVTFGEIAYQLLNQTLVYVELVDVASAQPSVNLPTPELSAAYEELQASERRFRALSDSAPMGIFLTDADGRILYHNQYCRQFTGISTNDAIPEGWIRTMHPNDIAGVSAALENSVRDHVEFDREFRLVDSDGNARWIHSRTNVLRSEAGEIKGRIGVIEDITERKQSEIELERVNQDLMKASREAGMAELASGVLHNVKNVINSVNISASVLGEQLRRSKASEITKVAALVREHAGDLARFITEDPKGKLLPRYLESLAAQIVIERESVLKELKEIEDSIQHIKNIVTVQQESAKLSGTTEKMKPVDLLEDSLRIVSASMARHGIELVREYEANLPEITVEKHKVLQVLVNFIRNAKQACQGSNRTDRNVVLRAAMEGEFVCLSVTDNGVGIAPENFSRLFGHGFTTKKEGHGFGLHSSAQVVRELGGDIQAHSEGVGKGATFMLKLPLRCPSENSQPASRGLEPRHSRQVTTPL